MIAALSPGCSLRSRDQAMTPAAAHRGITAQVLDSVFRGCNTYRVANFGDLQNEIYFDGLSGVLPPLADIDLLSGHPGIFLVRHQLASVLLRYAELACALGQYRRVLSMLQALAVAELRQDIRAVLRRPPARAVPR